jgi:hypothetical protein
LQGIGIDRDAGQVNVGVVTVGRLLAGQVLSFFGFEFGQLLSLTGFVYKDHCTYILPSSELKSNRAKVVLDKEK